MKLQTKESFEEYLAKIREEAGDKTVPPPMTDCPFCPYEGELTLKKDNFTKAVIPYIWTGTWWVYECPSCHEGFTTGGSDTISIATLKLAIK